ncbi:hypothetical protein ASPZODRAFT_12722 [Penicilliopsis zonata CBS 506.65]|uniref:Uncharacterized protein n=1 Tax=Penicilliopsis zonata CBS 506.65 TaxID=1073090 RepID=A0A1L9SR64_9EURO|nr:hypothetical protein ASPZODRAFT_12722 [Penicilliopsis zonata CBS 506.65]OJJ49597.1 hypothetical protein ASPZODRAFT_12722 [Penicilliopsis zonata CBS 506.65]
MPPPGQEICTKIHRIINDHANRYSRATAGYDVLSALHRVASTWGVGPEKVLYDTEARIGNGRETRLMHLQTADVRMPVCKARNGD